MLASHGHNRFEACRLPFDKWSPCKKDHGPVRLDGGIRILAKSAGLHPQSLQDKFWTEG
jgi:hypothetical protein